jgi:hypothetical protein
VALEGFMIHWIIRPIRIVITSAKMAARRQTCLLHNAVNGHTWCDGISSRNKEDFWLKFIESKGGCQMLKGILS